MHSHYTHNWWISEREYRFYLIVTVNLTDGQKNYKHDLDEDLFG